MFPAHDVVSYSSTIKTNVLILDENFVIDGKLLVMNDFISYSLKSQFFSGILLKEIHFASIIAANNINGNWFQFVQLISKLLKQT